MGETRTIPGVEEVDATLPADLELREIVDGEVVAMTGASDPHQHVVGELLFALMSWARHRGAVVRFHPFDVRTTRTRLRQPDVLVVLPAHRHRIGRDGMRGAPDLVVEVLSPSTRRTDLVEKRREYLGLGVTEYWCVDPDRRQAQVFTDLTGEPRGLAEDGTLASPLLVGFAVAVDDVLPPVP